MCRSASDWALVEAVEHAGRSPSYRVLYQRTRMNERRQPCTSPEALTWRLLAGAGSKRGSAASQVRLRVWTHV